MSQNTFYKNRPFEPDDEVLQALKDFPSPDFSPKPAAQGNKTNALFKKNPEPGQKFNLPAEEVVEIKPLTADDIEQIRQAAYDDGFLQGKEEGFSAGYAEGREQGIQDGQTQGQAEGRKTGLLEGETLIREQLAQLHSLLEQLQNPLQQLNAETEKSLLDLSLAMAEAVIQVEVKTNPQVILQTLRQAIDALPQQCEQIRIQLHPADLAIIEQHYTAEQIAERNWQLRAEPAVAQGDCLIATGHSTVQRQLKVRVQQSLEHFLQSPDQHE